MKAGNLKEMDETRKYIKCWNSASDIYILHALLHMCTLASNFLYKCVYVGVNMSRDIET